MIRNLTGLRFYLALWVVLYHVRDAIAIDVVSSVINFGFVGVDAFFVLSGFILTHVYRSTFFESNEVPRKELFHFLKKRFARIYPLHLVTLVGAIVFLNILTITTGSTTPLRWDHVIPQILLVHAWGGLDAISWNFPSWSISAEWFAYLFVFPLAALIFRRGAFRSLLLVTTLTIAVHIVVTYYFFQNDIGLQLQHGIVRIIPEFLLGVITCLLLRGYGRNDRTLIFAALVILSSMAVLFGNYQYLFVLALPLGLAVLEGGSSVVNSLFGSRPIVYLGEISFSIYMVHFFSRALNGIIHSNFFGSELNSPVYIVNYILLTLIFAALCFHYIEVPCRRYISDRINIIAT